MPDEPLIFVEVALTRGIPGSVQGLLVEDRKAIASHEADTAVFYSISNCQAGLASVSFGNSLIKQVAADLSANLPSLKTFVTLSPIPRLNTWLTDQGLEPKAGQRGGCPGWYLSDWRPSVHDRPVRPADEGDAGYRARTFRVGN